MLADACKGAEIAVDLPFTACNSIPADGRAERGRYASRVLVTEVTKRHRAFIAVSRKLLRGLFSRYSGASLRVLESFRAQI